jgi:benzil reductase ((S)-benzoin forming)
MIQVGNKSALVTGGGSGIGRALAKNLADKNVKVYIVGRRANKLEETKRYAADYIDPIVADVATVEGRQLIAKAVGNRPLSYLVHNAAVVEPLKTIDQMTLEEWRQHSAINLEAPLFLTQLLLPNLMSGSRLLNISSGLAHYALAGTGAYSISKAGLHMLYQVWNEELAPRGILAGSFQPGVIDTEMQQVLRTNKQFVNQPFFESLKSENKLVSAELVAEKLAWMLLEMDADEFVEKDWRIDALKER